MELREAVNRVRYELYRAEGFSDEDIRLEIPPPGTREYARYIDRQFELSEKRTPEVATAWRNRLNGALDISARVIPKSEQGLFASPVADLIANPGKVIEDMIGCFYGDDRLFERLRGKLRQNAERLGKKRPSECPDPVQYFAGTPLRWLFEAVMPFGYAEEARFEGQWVVGRQGAGKTNLLSCQILRDFDRVARGEACVIVIDPTGAQPGQLISNVITHKRFARGGDLYGRLIYVDPTDEDYAVPINLMSLRADGRGSVGTAISGFLSVMGGLMNQPLTGFQEPVFRAAVQLAMVMERPTLATLRRIIEPDSTVYEQYLDRLDPELREYFTQSFDSDRVRDSRAQILNRLHTLSLDKDFRRFFQYDTTRLDFNVVMNQPNVIVINCNRNALQSYTKIFGRFYFSLIVQAGAARERIPRPQRLPTFVYFDEAGEILEDDPNAAFMIFKLRQMNMGLIIGMQDSEQAKGDVRRAFSSAAIKFANCNRGSARDLADDMGAPTPDILMNRPRGQFMLSVAGRTQRPIAVNVPHVVSDHGWKDEPAMTKGEFVHVLSDIRSRFYVPTDRSSAPDPEPEPEAAPETAASEPEDDTEPEQAAASEPPHTKPQRPRTRGRGKRGKDKTKPNQPHEDPPQQEDV